MKPLADAGYVGLSSSPSVAVFPLGARGVVEAGGPQFSQFTRSQCALTLSKGLVASVAFEGFKVPGFGIPAVWIRQY
jgi:hypothetical protein